MRRLLFPLSAAAALLLAGCASSFPEKAYKLGQAYTLGQEAAITYIEVAKPSQEVKDKINAADDRAAPMVKQVLQCARDIVAAEQSGSVPDDAAELGLSAGEALEAKEAACEGLLSRALTLMQALQTATES